MGPIISKNFNNYINFCGRIDVHECEQCKKECAHRKIENIPSETSNQVREKSTNVDENSTGRKSSQVTLINRIQERSNNSIDEAEDYSKQVNENIAVQESSHVNPTTQKEKRSDEYADQVKDNLTKVEAEIDLIDLNDSSSKDSNDSVVPTKSTADECSSNQKVLNTNENPIGTDSKNEFRNERGKNREFSNRSRNDSKKGFVNRQSIHKLPKGFFINQSNNENEFENVSKKNQIPTQIEITYVRDGTVKDDYRYKIAGVYQLFELRNGEPCYRQSQDKSKKRPCLRFKRFRKYTSKGGWVIFPILHTFSYKTNEPDVFDYYEDKQITIRLRKILPTINAHEYEYETPWDQFYDCLGLNSETETDRIEMGLIQIKALLERPENNERLTSPW